MPNCEQFRKEIDASEGELHFVKEPVEKQKAEEPEPKGKLKYLIPLFCIILILASYACYKFGYDNGYSSAFKVGHDLGYNQGYAAGNLTAYELGYNNGNLSGYSLGYQYGNLTGYESGYGIGNSSGYTLGYQYGNLSGYELGYGNGNSTGYTLGYNNGNLTGYESGYRNGNSTGYSSGYGNGYLKGVIDGAGTGYNIRDPAYQEMLTFIALDRTDENQYSENYSCFHFTADVEAHAYQAGYRCGFVHIEYPDYAHAIVCFDTTDQGLIFIEPQLDDIVTLSIGQSYSNLNEYKKPDFNDTIISFTIIW